MSEKENHEHGIRAAIESLIRAGTTFDGEALNRLYHQRLRVITTDLAGTVSLADKDAFMGLFAAKKAAGDAPLGTWARFDHIDASDRAGHVLVSRVVDLGAGEQRLTLSIDLVHEDGRWQVTREVIFARPADETT